MPRRLHQTLADYVVIAISPALIMTLVGSLVYFLLRVFYQGDYQERLHWVMACFVFGAVLISRISIEQGFERAAPFGIALAVLVGIAANTFMEYHGGWIDDFSWIVNFTLIAIVWWCAHKLTWDCTVIDDSQDASGEGLMQVAGLERPADERNAVADNERRLEGTTARQVPAGYWQRYVMHQRRPHAPGVWVVYFSLAALPIFGVGQWLIPAGDTAGRRYVFWLLCIYVASGLGLLLTTSFLGLRRYLRQRRIEMPTVMANLWLSTGVVIVLLLLVAAALLPRPSAEYAISELPFTLGSPRAESSKMAASDSDGTQDDEPGPAAAQEASDDDPSGDEPPAGAGNQPQGKADGDDAASAKSAESKSPADGQGESSSDQGKQQSSPGEAGQSSQEGGADQDEATDADEQHPSLANEEARSKVAEAMEKFRQQQEDRAQANQPDSESPDDGSLPDSTGAVFQSVQQPVVSLILWLRWAFNMALVVAVLVALWRYRREVLAAVRGFLAELRAWWARLLGGQRDAGAAADETPEIRIPTTPFAAYANPFTSGAAERASVEELVRYSFEAFEAWSREHGCPHEPEQTPHELARDVGRLNKFISAEARGLAELYARAAYARGALPPDSAGQLRQLWAKMRSGSGVRTFTADELQSRT